jgi:cytosine/adenosine deaminase-related metal-dependent hydrolase
MKRGGRFALETAAGHRLVVEDGRIAPADASAPVRHGLEAAELRPGLINAHDHLTFNHYPRLGTPPYANLYRWAEHVHAQFGEAVALCRRLPRETALLFSALKNLLGGVTRVVHHDRWSPELGDGFPVKVERVRVVHSLQLEPGLHEDPKRASAPGDPPLCMHLAEGVDEVAQKEVPAAARLGLLGPGVLAVHLLGVDSEGVRLLAEAGVGFVWCPSSALHLYHAAAPAELFTGGLDVLLGTDSLLSAEGTLLEELAVAQRLGLASDAQLERAVGETPARRFGLATPTLEPGAPADVIALRAPLLCARPADVALVLVGGVPRYGDAAMETLFRRAGVATETITVGGVPKLVAAPLGRVARQVLELSPECGRIFA